jgi:hypothetical protein
MGNCAFVSFKKNIDLNLCVEKLREVNASRFDGCLRIELYGDNGISVLTPEDETFWFWRISPRKLEWKHPRGDIQWWLFEYIASYMIRSIYPLAQISDEGIDEKMAPNFDINYPTALSWLHGTANSLEGKIPGDRHAEMVSAANGVAELLKETTHSFILEKQLDDDTNHKYKYPIMKNFSHQHSHHTSGLRPTVMR